MPVARAAKSKPRKNRNFILLLLLLLAAGGGTIGYVVLKPPPVVVKVVDGAHLPPPKGPVMGSEAATVEMVMFGDFECPGCGQFARLTEPDIRTRLVNTGLVRFRYMDFPLTSIHPSTLFAHNAAACANAQGKFWEMHDSLYAGQLEWSAFANRRDMNAPKVMKRFAKQIGLDTKAFSTCLDSHEFEAQIRANAEEGQKVGVTGTPNFLIGKRLIPNAPYDVIKLYVDSAIADAKKPAEALAKPAVRKP